MARSLVLLLLLAALAVPAAARAQSDPFSPLPPAQQPTAEPTPAPTSVADQQDVSRGLLFGIAGAVLVVFVGIGMYITRDARRSLTEHDRRGLDHVYTEQERERGEIARKKARAKGKRQRQARKAQRRR
jgi:glucose/arabinose dehydrogenase